MSAEERQQLDAAISEYLSQLLSQPKTGTLPLALSVAIDRHIQRKVSSLAKYAGTLLGLFAVIATALGLQSTWHGTAYSNVVSAASKDITTNRDQFIKDLDAAKEAVAKSKKTAEELNQAASDNLQVVNERIKASQTQTQEMVRATDALKGAREQLAENQASIVKEIIEILRKGDAPGLSEQIASTIRELAMVRPLFTEGEVSELQRLLSAVTITRRRHPKYPSPINVLEVDSLHVNKWASVAGKLFVGDKGYAKFGFVEDDQPTMQDSYPMVP